MIRHKGWVFAAMLGCTFVVGSPYIFPDNKSLEMQVKSQRKEYESIGRTSVKTNTSVRYIIPDGKYIFVDIKKEHIAVAEAKRLNIPTFAIVDTNSDPRKVDFVIPGNDDASKSVDMILSVVSDSIKDGLSQRKADKEKTKEEGEKVSADADADFDAAAE